MSDLRQTTAIVRDVVREDAPRRRLADGEIGGVRPSTEDPPGDPRRELKGADSAVSLVQTYLRSAANSRRGDRSGE